MGADINNMNNMCMNNKIQNISVFVSWTLNIPLFKYVYPLVFMAQVFLSFELG